MDRPTNQCGKVYSRAYATTHLRVIQREDYNKAGYTAIQSRMVGQEQWSENCLNFKNVTDGRTDRPRQGVVACPRLKTVKKG